MPNHNGCQNHHCAPLRRSTHRILHSHSHEYSSTRKVLFPLILNIGWAATGDNLQITIQDTSMSQELTFLQPANIKLLWTFSISDEKIFSAGWKSDNPTSSRNHMLSKKTFKSEILLEWNGSKEKIVLNLRAIRSERKPSQKNSFLSHNITQSKCQVLNCLFWYYVKVLFHISTWWYFLCHTINLNNNNWHQHLPWNIH